MKESRGLMPLDSDFLDSEAGCCGRGGGGTADGEGEVGEADGVSGSGVATVEALRRRSSILSL